LRACVLSAAFVTITARSFLFLVVAGITMTTGCGVLCCAMCDGRCTGVRMTGVYRRVDVGPRGRVECGGHRAISHWFRTWYGIPPGKAIGTGSVRVCAVGWPGAS
jgi:hypothetical protein